MDRRRDTGVRRYPDYRFEDRSRSQAKEYGLLSQGRKTRERILFHSLQRGFYTTEDTF